MVGFNGGIYAVWIIDGWWMVRSPQTNTANSSKSSASPCCLQWHSETNLYTYIYIRTYESRKDYGSTKGASSGRHGYIHTCLMIFQHTLSSAVDCEHQHEPTTSTQWEKECGILRVHALWQTWYWSTTRRYSNFCIALETRIQGKSSKNLERTVDIGVSYTASRFHQQVQGTLAITGHWIPLSGSVTSGRSSWDGISLRKP